MWSSFTRSEWDAPIGMRATRAADKRPKIIELKDIPMWIDTFADIEAEEAALEAAEAEAEDSTNSPSASDLSANASASANSPRSRSRSKSASRGKSPRARFADYSHATESKPDSTAAAAAASSDERKTNADPTASKADSAKADASSMQDVEAASAEVGPPTAAAAAAASSSAASSTAAPAAAAAAAADADEDLPVDPHSVDVASALDLDSITTDTENRAELYEKFFKPDAAINAKVRLYKGDITRLKVDAIVNAANSGLWAGGGICGAIFDAAGEERLKRACRTIRQASGDCPPGETRLTRGFLLPAPFILHTVGPMDGDELDLIRSYESTLDMCAHPILAEQKAGETIAIRSVALCCISTGIYGFENDAACEVALRTTRLWLEKHPAEAAQMDAIVFCVFLEKDLKLYRDMMPIFFPVEEEDDEEEDADAAVESSQNKKQKQKQQQSPRPKAAASGAANKSGAASSSSSAAVSAASAFVASSSARSSGVPIAFFPCFASFLRASPSPLRAAPTLLVHVLAAFLPLRQFAHIRPQVLAYCSWTSQLELAQSFCVCFSPDHRRKKHVRLPWKADQMHA